MSITRIVSGLFKAPWRRRKLAAEAAAELVRARVMTLLPARIYTRDLGRMDQKAEARMVDQTAAETADRVGRMVEAVARYMPFRALCLQQAIAVRRMLDRRHVPAAVFLGVARDRADRQAAELGRAAHAWVEVGNRVVSGGGELSRYAVIARFA